MTITQIIAFLSVLSAFGIPQPTIDQIQGILMPKTPVTTVQYVPVVQSPVIPNTPIQFGSTPTNSQPAVIQSPTMPTIEIISTDDSGKPTTTVKAGTGVLKMQIKVLDANGAFTKVPVTVTTNDPDMPASFLRNVPRETSPLNNADFFCVAPWNDSMGTCQIENPVSKGTFDFTFEALGVSKTVQVTVE